MQAAKDVWEPATVQQLYDESIRLMQVNVAQAERLARSASWLSGKLEDDGSRALGFRAMGNILYLKGKYEEANDGISQGPGAFTSTSEKSSRSAAP